MSTVITVENLSKKYLLSHQTQRQPYVALRDVIAEKTNAVGRRLLHPFRSSNPTPQTSAEDFWALKDVSFEIKQGERVGIIGRNGAGKSTLLKILSRIVEPSAGRVRIKGRVASLLEVGTGFHPELTGRENIFLNGAILGMTRFEIKKKFDEIVDFAEIEKFLDTPVKRYSSGMYVRLAFAVAAHLEPEILLVDEVLAVGDAQFQKKCLGKMEDVSAREGRTVIFVSHNMGAVMSLCNRGVVLYQGSIVADKTPAVAISRYVEMAQSTESACYSAYSRNGIATLNVELCDANSQQRDSFIIGQEIVFSAYLHVDRPLKAVAFGIGVETVTGVRVITFHTKYQHADRIDIDSEVVIRFIWAHSILCAGSYRIVAALYEGDMIISSWENIAALTIVATDYFATGRLPDPSHQGHVLNNARIEIEHR